MKLIYRILFLTAICVLVSAPCLIAVQSEKTEPSANVTSDELDVYASILDFHPKLGLRSRPLIADSTSTFSCSKANATFCNGLNMGGCNGLRSENERPADRMAIVQQDIPSIQGSILKNFQEQNLMCASIPPKIPAQTEHYLYSLHGDNTIPKSWKYTFLVYFSRVGFNPDHSQALVNVGLFSASDAKDSKGAYFFLKKKDRKWEITQSSSNWELIPDSSSPVASQRHTMKTDRRANLR